MSAKTKAIAVKTIDKLASSDDPRSAAYGRLMREALPVIEQWHKAEMSRQPRVTSDKQINCVATAFVGACELVAKTIVMAESEDNQ